MKWLLNHQIHTAKYSVMIGSALGLDKESLEDLETAALLHDIGKNKIPIKILSKKGKLDSREMYIMRQHAKYSAEILEMAKYKDTIVKAVLYHHERVDGNGYFNLKESEINLFAKIITIADAYDAITSKRPYRKAKNKEEAIKEIEKNLGSQFDEELGSIFISLLK